MEGILDAGAENVVPSEGESTPKESACWEAVAQEIVFGDQERAALFEELYQLYQMYDTATNE